MTVPIVFTKPAAELITDLINNANNTTFEAADLIFATPQPFSEVGVDANTSLVVTGSDNGQTTFRGPSTVKYRRLDLATILAGNDLDFVDDLAFSSTTDYLAAINARFGINIDADMVVVEAVTRPGTYPFDLTIQAAPNSLVYSGSLTIGVLEPEADGGGGDPPMFQQRGFFMSRMSFQAVTEDLTTFFPIDDSNAPALIASNGAAVGAGEFGEIYAFTGLENGFIFHASYDGGATWRQSTQIRQLYTYANHAYFFKGACYVVLKRSDTQDTYGLYRVVPVGLGEDRNYNFERVLDLVNNAKIAVSADIMAVYDTALHTTPNGIDWTRTVLEHTFGGNNLVPEINALAFHSDGKLLGAGKVQGSGSETVPRMIFFHSDLELNTLWFDTSPYVSMTGSFAGSYISLLSLGSKVLLVMNDYYDYIPAVGTVGDFWMTDDLFQTWRAIQTNTSISQPEVLYDGNLVLVHGREDIYNAGQGHWMAHSADQGETWEFDTSDGQFFGSTLDSPTFIAPRIFNEGEAPGIEPIPPRDYYELQEMPSGYSGPENLGGEGGNVSPNGWTYHTAWQSDGKLVFCGEFDTLPGVANYRTGLGRYNTDGSLDADYAPLAAELGNSITMYDFVLDPDDKVVVVGSFTTVNGVARGGIARLNVDGSLDTSFIPPTWDAPGTTYPRAIVRQPDGKYIIAGNIGISDDPTYYISTVRLNADGSLDDTFVCLGGSQIERMYLLASGKVITLNNPDGGTPNLLNSDGSADLTFPDFSGATVRHVLQLADGDIIFFGDNIPDGDSGFQPCVKYNTSWVVQQWGQGQLPQVRAATQMADGVILLGGNFTTVGGIPTRRLVAVDTDGVVVPDYLDLGLDYWVLELQTKPNGETIVVGGFSYAYQFGYPRSEPVPRGSIARFTPKGFIEL